MMQRIKSKKSLLILFAVCMMMLCQAFSVNAAIGRAIVMDPQSATMTVGQTKQFHMYIGNGDFTSYGYWRSSNSSVASVSNGKVTAKAPGTAVIYSTYLPSNVTVSAVVTVKKSSSLATPKINSIKVTQRGLQIKWNRVTNAEKYKLYCKKAGSSSWTLLKTTTGTSYHHVNLGSGTKYYYTVRAVKGSKISGYNKSGWGYYYLKTPSLNRLATDGRGVIVSWTRSPGATGYVLYRKVNNSSKWTKYKNITGGSSVRYVDYNISKYNTYTYTVRPVKGNYFGTYNSKGISGYVY